MVTQILTECLIIRNHFIVNTLNLEIDFFMGATHCPVHLKKTTQIDSELLKKAVVNFRCSIHIDIEGVE